MKVSVEDGEISIETTVGKRLGDLMRLGLLMRCMDVAVNIKRNGMKC